MKKWLIISTIIILILICFPFLFSSSKWNGISKDGKWEATLIKNKHIESSLQYYGYLIWKGSNQEAKKLTILQIKYKVNGKVITVLKENDIKSKDNTKKIGFVEFTGEPNKNDKVEVVINWKEGKVIHKETIYLKKKFLF